jgi:hypothetical protein
MNGFGGRELRHGSWASERLWYFFLSLTKKPAP